MKNIFSNLFRSEKEKPSYPEKIQEINERKPEEEKDMTEMAKKELIQRIKGLDAEEMVLVARALPVEVCLDRIRDDLRAASSFRKFIASAYNRSFAEGGDQNGD